MICPECKNKGWKPDEVIKKPVRVVSTQEFRSFVQRYRYCHNCGYRFTTKEEFYQEVGGGKGFFDEDE